MIFTAFPSSSSTAATSADHRCGALPSISPSFLTVVFRKTLPMGAIIGIVIAISVLISVGIFLAWLRRRRYRRRERHGTEAPNRAASPFSPLTPNAIVPMIQESSIADDSNRSRAGSVSAERQQHLANELRAVQEKMVDLESFDGHTSTTAARRSPASRQVLRLVSAWSIPSAKEAPGSQDMAAQLETSSQRNESLATRVRKLEEYMHSPRALGMSDEPPPGYTAESSDAGVP